MRHPKELRDEDLQEIAGQVRQAMNAKFFGSFDYWLQKSNGMANEFARQTYLAVRAKLEKEV